ncbi:MAG: diacylglycerol kinase family protein [Clostridia bacterium]
MRYYLVLNPGSKGGKSRKTFERIFQLFHQNNIEFDYKITASLQDAYKFSVDANQKGYDIIVAVGGDGTINRVVNGFYDAEGNRTSTTAILGVIYTGTSPDFCKSYHIPTILDQAVQVLLTGKTKSIQIGKIVHTCIYDAQYDNQPVSQVKTGLKTTYFTCCANIGIGAALARRANGGVRKYIGDIAGTFLSLIITLWRYQPSSFTVGFDGNMRRIEKVFNLSIGKTTFIASGIKVKNDLLPEDKRFYHLLVKSLRWTNWLSVFRAIYSGKQITNNALISLQYAEKIEVYGNHQNPEIEFDGDPGGFLPCTIETAQYAIELICGGYHE